MHCEKNLCLKAASCHGYLKPGNSINPLAWGIISRKDILDTGKNIKAPEKNRNVS